MALAFIITLQKELPDAQAIYVKAKSGKAVARESDRLDNAAKSRGVAPITSLLSESQATLIEQMKAEGMDPLKMRLPPEHWFSPTEGLKTVRALADHVTTNLNNYKQPNPILRDLKAAEGLLVAAEGSNVQFHFTKVDL
jgi:hypothetical protein